MSDSIKPESSQLSEIEAKLTSALADRERRVLRLERTVRWVGFSIVLGALMLFAAFSGGISNALAQLSENQDHGMPQAKTTVEALNNINASLEGMRMMSMMMKMGMQAGVTKAMTPPPEDPECKDSDTELVYHLYCFNRTHTQQRAQGLGVEVDQLTLEQRQGFAQEAVMIAAGSVMVDMGILTHRVKEDSDLWRTSGLQGIREELTKLNHMVTAIPAMANEMNVMNRQMTVMSHGVGTTMGRVGNWLPW